MAFVLERETAVSIQIYPPKKTYETKRKQIRYDKIIYIYFVHISLYFTMISQEINNSQLYNTTTVVSHLSLLPYDINANTDRRDDRLAAT